MTVDLDVQTSVSFLYKQMELNFCFTKILLTDFTQMSVTLLIYYSESDFVAEIFLSHLKGVLPVSH